MENEFTNTPVLVNPDFYDDPHQSAGQVGQIQYLDAVTDQVVVAFEDGQNKLYSSNALLTLKPPAQVYQNALVHLKEMEPADFKTLLKINIIQEARDPEQLKQAYAFALVSEKVRQHSLDTLESRLDPSIELSEGLRKPPIISR